MYGPKEAAIMILGKGKKNSPDMAEELVAAVQDGDTQGILDAIHGIYMSY